ncbi:MAG: redoxin domain-containing protein [Planctomycetota bacterium]
MRALALFTLAALAAALAAAPVAAQEPAQEPAKGPAKGPAQEKESQAAIQASVSRLMTEAYDEMEAGARLLAPEGSTDERVAQGKARYERAVAAYGRVLELLPKVEGVPQERLLLVEQIARYNTACAQARQGKADEALSALAKALERGYEDLRRVETDPDLASIREHPRFVNMLERVQARLAKQAVEAAKAELSKEALFPYDFKVTTLDGKVLKLSDLRGKVVIVDYWGTWCPPCRAEIPHFVKLRKELAGKLEVVGMTWERGQGGEQVTAGVRAFAKELGVEYPLALLTKQEDLAKVPNLEAFPTTLFLDRQGRVRAREVGFRDLDALKKLVDGLLAEPAPAPTPAPGSDEKKPF